MSENLNATGATIDEVIIIVIEEWGESHPHYHTHRHKFTILNKNDGDTIHLGAGDNTLISKVIDRMYHKFAIERHQEDRLHCKSGSEVFPYARLTVAKYLEEGHCPHLHWEFAGNSGGA